jgi:prephenate dehydrogenase
VSTSTRLGILGGTGGMGSLFARLYGAAGWEVSARGRTGHEPLPAFLARQDVVMVSVPIDATLGVIAAVAPHLRKDQLLCDLTSLKAAPVEAMRRSAAPAVGLHPIFGPGLASIAGQTVAVTLATATEAEYGPLLAVLEAAGARLAFTTPERHDELMAVVQGLAHALSLVLAGTVRELGADLDELLAFTSPVYRIELGLVGRLLGQDPALYGPILRRNPHVPAVLEAAGTALQELADAVEDPGPGTFARLFEEDAALFAPYAATATAETDRLIGCLAEPVP